MVNLRRSRRPSGWGDSWQKKKTITIKDNGIGMTADEIDKYINQIAFSGAEEFVKKYEVRRRWTNHGHFGLGSIQPLWLRIKFKSNLITY